jgi:glycogen(starch) synthase
LIRVASCEARIISISDRGGGMIDTDVLLLSLSDLSQDARTLNLARALSQRGYRVAVHAACTSDIANSAALTILPWDDPGGRAMARWWSLMRSTQRLQCRARLTIGMDFFALGPARSFARRSRTALLYDMREFYFALGPLAGKGLRQRMIAWYERYLMRSVDDVLVSAPLDAEIVQQRFELPRTPTVLLNTPPWREVVPSPLRERCGLDTATPLAIYQGVIHHGRGIAPFLRAMQQLHEIHLVILGDGPAQEDLQRYAHELRVDARVHWMGSVPYDALHAYTCGADIGLCLIEPLSMSYEYALPNKLFEYIMARVPVLATDLPALRRVYERYSYGMLVDRRLDAADIVSAVRSVLDHRRCGEGGLRDAYARTISYEQQSTEAIGLCAEYLR